MEKPVSSRLLDHFASVTDPRSRNARHSLFDIFVIAPGVGVRGRLCVLSSVRRGLGRP